MGVGIPLLLIFFMAAIALAVALSKLKKIRKTFQRRPRERGKGLCMFVNKICSCELNYILYSHKNPRNDMMKSMGIKMPWTN